MSEVWIFVSAVSPLPRFLDNRVVLLPIWKLPPGRAGAPVPAAISDKCYCLWDQGRAEGDFHCLSNQKRNVSCLYQHNSWTKYEAPSLPTWPTAQNVNTKEVFTVFLFDWIPYFVFYQVRLAWVDSNVFIIVSVGHSDNSGTPCYVWVIPSPSSHSLSHDYNHNYITSSQHKNRRRFTECYKVTSRRDILMMLSRQFWLINQLK